MLTVNKKNMTRFSCCQHRFTTLQEANEKDDGDDDFTFKLFYLVTGDWLQLLLWVSG